MLHTTTSTTTSVATPTHLVDDYTFLVKINFTDKFKETTKKWKVIQLASGPISKKPDADEKAFGYFKFLPVDKKTGQRNLLPVYRVKKITKVSPEWEKALEAMSPEARSSVLPTLPKSESLSITPVNEKKFIALCDDAFNDQESIETHLHFHLEDDVLEQMLSKRKGSLWIYFTFAEGGYHNTQDPKLSHSGEDIVNGVYLYPQWIEVHDSLPRTPNQLDMDVVDAHIKGMDEEETTPKKGTYSNSKSVDEKAYLLLDINKKAGNKKASYIVREFFEKYVNEDRDHPVFIKAVNDYYKLANNTKARMSIAAWEKLVEEHNLDLSSLLEGTAEAAEADAGEVYGETSEEELKDIDLF